MKRKIKKEIKSDKINLGDWKKLIIKKGKNKRKIDSQKVLQELRYGKPIYC